MKWFILLCFLIAATVAQSDPNRVTYAKNSKTLVVLDDWHYVDSHSQFWNQLRGKLILFKSILAMNFELDFKMVDDPSIKLTYFGEYLYSNIVFMAPSVNEGNQNLLIFN